MDTYSPGPGLTLGVTGAAEAREHFSKEYGAARIGDGAAPDVLVGIHFAKVLPGGAPRDGHKTVRWSVELGGPDERPLRARITVAGRPRRFALSLVQGYVVEPLASLAAAGAGSVLLPAAALVDREAAVVLLGRSRSGKTSVVARAVAAGRGALGDDQVVVDQRGQVRAWPRRLRVYPDLRLTAPRAVAALPWQQRRALWAMRWVAVATRGVVAPSLPLLWSALGSEARRGPLGVGRIVVVVRGDAGAEIAVRSLQVSDVVELSAVILREQRIRLAHVAGQNWVQALQAAEASERRTLEAALRWTPAEQWTVPELWSAPEAVSALAARLGVEAD